MSCPACGAAPLVDAGPLRRCPSCGSAVTVAPAREGARDEGRVRPRGSGLAAPLLALFDAERLRSVPAAPARLLDVGAGRGRFVAAARRAGYEASGIEPSPRGVEAARSVYGVELEAATVDEWNGSGVDVVTAWHVLEHLDDAGGALGRIASWLRPGGTLVLGVPNVASLQARAAGRRWFHLDLARHRVHFTPAGLHALLRRGGFEVVRTRHVLLEHNPGGMWLSLVPTRTPAYVFQLVRGTTRFDALDTAITVAALPLLPVAALVEWAAGLARRGGTIVVVARRAP